jgi:hypothetical protein
MKLLTIEERFRLQRIMAKDIAELANSGHVYACTRLIEQLGGTEVIVREAVEYLVTVESRFPEASNLLAVLTLFSKGKLR